MSVESATTDLFQVEVKNRLEYYIQIEEKLDVIYRDKIKKLENLLDSSTKELEALKYKHSQLNSDHKTAGEELGSLRTEKTKLSASLEEQQKATARAERQAVTAKEKFDESNKETNELRREVKRLNAMEPDKLKKRFVAANEELKKLRKETTKYTRDAREMKRKMEQLQKELDTLKAEKEAAESKEEVAEAEA